ncbi:hypothetical protein Bca4012_016634 [Brassica carinata]|uniref:Uncharacterized protein n=1 Tax=Brassica carinata TaxID=52824 RepID=A0A8X8BGJ5_BRACI|nr:hypothetical protein Bca52824_004938 [Brassica carinata]
MSNPHFCYSDSVSAKINCFHSGVFTNGDDGKLNYVDGLLEQFEVDSDGTYEEVFKIIGQIVSVERMWYKLPYEDISDKKELLENGEKNKKRMTSNGRYYGELDVFIEKPETAVLSVDGAVGDAETEHAAVDGDEFDAEQQDDEDDGDHEAEESEDEYQTSDESNNEHDIDRNFEEDLEMFRDENYEDEILDEDEVYHDTEQSSDDEEEQAERMANRGKLDGVFSLRQTII